MKLKTFIALTFFISQVAAAIGSGGRAGGGGRGFGGGKVGTGGRVGSNTGGKSNAAGKSAARATVRGAATSSTAGYNLARLSSNKSYSRFNPSFGHAGNPTPLQTRLSSKASAVAAAIAQRHQRVLPAQSSLSPLSGLFLPWNPYFWIYHSIFFSHDHSSSRQQQNQQQNLIASKNMMLNDRILEQSVLMEECLVNAKKLGIHQQYCQDLSYDLRVELKEAHNYNELVFNKLDLRLSVSQKTDGPDSLIAKTTETGRLPNPSPDQSLLVLNVTLAEVIASLSESADFVIRLDGLTPQSWTLNLKDLLKTPNRYKSQQLAELYSVQAKVTKILPSNLKLTENLTQPLGLNVEDVKNCARYFIKLGVDVQLCLKTLEMNVKPEFVSRYAMKSSGFYYSLYNNVNPLKLKDNEFTRLRNQMSLAEVISEYYADHYQGDIGSYPRFGFGKQYFRANIETCSKEIPRLAKEGLECDLSDSILSLRLNSTKVGVFQHEAEQLILTAEEENLISLVPNEFYMELKKFTSAEQVSALRLFLVAGQYYQSLPRDIVQNVKSPAKLQELETALRETGAYSLRPELQKIAE